MIMELWLQKIFRLSVTRSPSDVTSTSAVFNAYVTSTGNSPATVYVLWGEETGSWANTNSWNPGDWEEGSYPSTNITLSTDRNYYYTFGISNASSNVVASSPQYLITGEVTLEATDPVCRTNASDTAVISVIRPSNCTNEDLSIAFTLDGTAVLGTDYTVEPSGGSITLSQGISTNIITITPVYKQDGEKIVVVTLTNGLYAIGTPASATCTLAKVTGSDRYWVAGSSADWNNTANWSDETGGTGGFSVPGSSALAIFDGGGTGDCRINANANVKGMQIQSGYSGIITQGVGQTITMGSSGFSQADGTFAGSDQTITINSGSPAFTLSGGNFISTRGYLYINYGSDWTVSGGTFDANEGTVRILNAYQGTRTLSGSVIFHNLWFACLGE